MISSTTPHDKSSGDTTAATTDLTTTNTTWTQDTDRVIETFEKDLQRLNAELRALDEAISILCDHARYRVKAHAMVETDPSIEVPSGTLSVPTHAEGASQWLQMVAETTDAKTEIYLRMAVDLRAQFQRKRQKKQQAAQALYSYATRAEDDHNRDHHATRTGWRRDQAGSVDSIEER